MAPDPVHRCPIVRPAFLLRLSIVLVLGGAALSALVVPRFGVHPRARIRACENAAVATLKRIAEAQQEVRASAAIDTDGDGIGEYGFLSELAGVRPLRVAGADGPAAGSAVALLDPGSLPRSLGTVVPGEGCAFALRQGYVFQLYLPAGNREPVGVVPEPAAGECGDLPDPDGAEQWWCCYAWPERPGRSGLRVFFVDAGAVVYWADNAPTVASEAYEGLLSAPLFDAAYTRAGDVGSAPAGAARRLGQDGRAWRTLGE